jgi:hypothetical protein
LYFYSFLNIVRVGKINNGYIGWTCKKHEREEECIKILYRKALKKESTWETQT